MDSVFFRCPLFTSTFSLNYETANNIFICCDYSGLYPVSGTL